MSSIIVFDSSSLILLAKTELLDIFLEKFIGEVLISQCVKEECFFKPTPDAHLIKMRIAEKKILLKNVRDMKRCKQIMKDFNMNLGEAETILLGQEFRALIATDDWNALKACKLLRLPHTSILSILIRLKERKVIDKKVAILKLEMLSEYGRYGESILKDVRNKLED